MEAASHSINVQASSPRALTLDDYLIDDPKATALLRVRGGQSASLGIIDGDLLAVEIGSSGGVGDLIAISGNGFVAAVPYERRAQSTAQGGCEALGVVVSVVRRVRR